MRTLRKAVEEYLSLRRALGFKLEKEGRLLNQFIDFAEERGASRVTTELALRWATRSNTCQPAYWAGRLSVVRQFAKYQSGSDPRTEIPSLGLLPHHYQKKRPYVYTDAEINDLIDAARQLRSIPLHASTRDALAKYDSRRKRTLRNSNTPAFFVLEQDRRLSKSGVRSMFVKLTRRIGLRTPTGWTGPRIQDMRHRFAIRTLCRLYQAGEDVERHLPALSTYLGHVDVVSSYWYLYATPELLFLASRRLDVARQEAAL